MTKIDLKSLTWDDFEIVGIPMPNGRIDPTVILYNVKGLPRGVQGFTMYKGNPLFPKYDVIGIKDDLTYPPVKYKHTYVKDHEIIHKQRPELAAILGPTLAEYVTRVASDAVYQAKTGENVDTASDIFGLEDYNEYGNTGIGE
jgi:hypothetical protein